MRREVTNEGVATLDIAPAAIIPYKEWRHLVKKVFVSILPTYYHLQILQESTGQELHGRIIVFHLKALISLVNKTDLLTANVP